MTFYRLLALFFVEHDLFGKPVANFPDHAQAKSGYHGARVMKAVVRKLALAALLLLTAIPIARAEDRTVALRLGVTSRLLIDKAFDTVLIGDADVVSVFADDDNSVILEPLAPGMTNLVFVDDRHIAIANIRIAVCEGGPKSNAKATPAVARGEESASPCNSKP
jgi:Flp pilus assembly secretin CpaC